MLGFTVVVVVGESVTPVPGIVTGVVPTCIVAHPQAT